MKRVNCCLWRAGDVIFTFCVVQRSRLLVSDLVIKILNGKTDKFCKNTTNLLEYRASLSNISAGMQWVNLLYISWMESQTLTLAASIALFQHTNSMGRAWRKNAKHGVFAPQSCLFICIVYICEHRDTLRPLVFQRTKYKTTNKVKTEPPLWYTCGQNQWKVFTH